MRGREAAGLPRVLRRAGRPLARRVRRFRRRHELRDAVDTIRRARGRRLVLVYHRIEPREAPRYEIVPTVPLDLFRQQLAAIGEVAHLESLTALLDDPVDEAAPLRTAITLDDDYANHACYVLPVLGDLDLHATFFLSGRALHGLGGYWFQRLEALVAERGLSATAALLDLPDVAEEAQLPLGCEGDLRRQALIDRYAPPGPSPLDAAGIRMLADAGMTVGFHTLHHPVLPGLDDVGLAKALTDGRDRLAAFVGQPLQWFAYPHGKADDRTARLAAEAGYTAAWTTRPRILRAGDDPRQLGRWEPLPTTTDDLLIRLGRFLHDPGRLC